jgi:hypothetical protein
VPPHDFKTHGQLTIHLWLFQSTSSSSKAAIIRVKAGKTPA